MSYLWEIIESSNSQVPESYYCNPRSDLLDCSGLTTPPRAVLELGCGSGATLLEMRERWPNARLIGVEPNEVMAARAHQVASEILSGRIEDHLPLKTIDRNSLDLIIAGDVLEHLYNPWIVVRDLRPYIAGGGKFVASIPNVRNISILEQLAVGEWRYESAGLLDITHIRFFTRRTAEQMFVECGYRIEEISYRVDQRYQSLIDSLPDSGPIRLDFGSLSITVSQEEALELCALQLVVVATTP